MSADFAWLVEMRREGNVSDVRPNYVAAWSFLWFVFTTKDLFFAWRTKYSGAALFMAKWANICAPAGLGRTWVAAEHGFWVP